MTVDGLLIGGEAADEEGRVRRTPTRDDLATVETMAEELGIASSTLREWCRRGRFPNVKLPHARRILISRPDAETYLTTGCALDVKLLDGGGRLVQPARRQR